MNEKTPELWLKYKKTRSVEARNALVEHYLPLTEHIVRLMYPVCRSFWEAGDICQCAVLGLISAVEGYKDGYGASFETYASARIRGAVLDFMRGGGLVHIPRSMEGGTSPYLCSLEELTEDGGLEALSSELSPEESALEGDERERLERALQALPLNEYAVVSGIYFGGRTYKSVARSLGLSRSRVWQLGQSALARLREALE